MSGASWGIDPGDLVRLHPGAWEEAQRLSKKNGWPIPEYDDETDEWVGEASFGESDDGDVHWAFDETGNAGEAHWNGKTWVGTLPEPGKAGSPTPSEPGKAGPGTG